MKSPCSLKYLISLAFLFVGGNSYAITITASDLPSAFQGCAPTECSVALTSTTDIGGMSAFRVREGAGSGALRSYLLRYSLYEPSNASSGYVWMKVQEEYTLSNEQHTGTLYFDQVNPSPSSIGGGSNPLVLDFSLTSPALLAGGGIYAVNCCSGTPPMVLDLIPSGLAPCAAEGCAVRAELNLVYLFYQPTLAGSTARISFDATDDRALLYSQASSYNGQLGTEPYYAEQSYYVAPVPLPAAAWMLLSGLGALGVFRRQRIATTGLVAC